MPTPKGQDSEMDREPLSPWSIYTKSVNRIITHKRQFTTAPHSSQRPCQTNHNDTPPLFWHDSLKETAEGAMGRDTTRSRKMRDIDATLDLHGLSQKQAFSRLYHFIDGALKRKHRTIRVITGKGRKLGDAHSFSILQQILPLWCREPPLSLWIFKIERARSCDGGDGAYYLFLRKPK